jgi:hypothetical protein
MDHEESHEEPPTLKPLAGDPKPETTVHATCKV